MSKVVSSAKALIIDHGKFLIIKEKIGDEAIWDLPGGKIEYGESPQAAVKREVKEELNIKVKVGKSVGVWWFISAHTQNQVICHTFACQTVGKYKIDFSHNPAQEEIVAYQWLSKAEFLEGDFSGLSSSLKELVVKLEMLQ